MNAPEHGAVGQSLGLADDIGHCEILLGLLGTGGNKLISTMTYTNVCVNIWLPG